MNRLHKIFGSSADISLNFPDFRDCSITQLNLLRIQAEHNLVFTDYSILICREKNLQNIHTKLKSICMNNTECFVSNIGMVQSFTRVLIGT